MAQSTHRKPQTSHPTSRIPRQAQTTTVAVWRSERLQLLRCRSESGIEVLSDLSSVTSLYWAQKTQEHFFPSKLTKARPSTAASRPNTAWHSTWTRGLKDLPGVRQNAEQADCLSPPELQKRLRCPRKWSSLSPWNPHPARPQLTSSLSPVIPELLQGTLLGTARTVAGALAQGKPAFGAGSLGHNLQCWHDARLLGPHRASSVQFSNDCTRRNASTEARPWTPHSQLHDFCGQQPSETCETGFRIARFQALCGFPSKDGPLFSDVLSLQGLRLTKSYKGLPAE